MTWKPHIESLEKSVSKYPYIFSKIRHFVPLYISRQLYYSLSKLTYGIEVWPTAYTSSTYSIATIQKKIFRIISFSGFKDHSGPLFKLWRILPMQELVNFKIALLMHQIINNRFHRFPFVIQFSRPTHNYSTRFANGNSLSFPLTHTNHKLRSLHHAGAAVWNSLPSQTQQTSFRLFKQTLFSQLIDNICSNCRKCSI